MAVTVALPVGGSGLAAPCPSTHPGVKVTVIAGLVDVDYNVWIGGDSAGVSEDGSLVVRDDSKVFVVGDAGADGSHYIFGFTSSFRMGQLLRYSLKVEPPPVVETIRPAGPGPATDGLTHGERGDEGDPDPVYQFMATTFIEAVRDCLRSGGWNRKHEERESGGTFMVGTAGRLFVVHSDYQVGEPLHGYAAIGSGSAYALGAMAATINEPGRAGTMTPKLVLTRALYAAQAHCASVRGPMVIRSLVRRDLLGVPTTKHTVPPPSR